jgi:hypothetical protein
MAKQTLMSEHPLFIKQTLLRHTGKDVFQCIVEDFKTALWACVRAHVQVGPPKKILGMIPD